MRKNRQPDPFGFRRCLLGLCVFVVAGVVTAHSPQIDPALLAGMKARSIGPAGMSGRVAAIEVVPSNHDVIYVGAATGGLWKSTNGGLNFAPIFDDQPVAAIGAVAVHPKRPAHVWVGTGEGNPRNSISVGNGVYRSRDGGRTWKHIGLEATERIHRVILHPDDPDTAWVAALGPTWGEHPQRGVFRTRDGGETWEKVLYVNERTGAADLVIDPSNPDKLIASMWEHRRWPWFFRSGGPASGLFVTHDGGETWTEVTAQDGLPEGDLGRIGLAVAPSDPDRVYAFVEAERNGFYRSDDGGESWRKTTDEGDFGNRPFYYADLRVDPKNPDRVYSLWSLVSVSIDGGKTWKVLVPWSSLHPDHHAMWIDPEDPSHIWDGNDGGIGVSHDYGKTWRFVANLPLAQYYHIAVDDERPYNVYGGMQDNGSWRGPSAVWENGGIRNHHWEEVGFGDGFDTRPDPEDPMRGYAMSQRGHLFRWDLRTGERKMIRPSSPDPEIELRFSWNAGFAQDPFDPATIYFGSQYLHRSQDRGETWEVVSPDLTTDDPDWQRQEHSGGLTPDVTGAENFTTIVAVSPSPLERGVLWVGTDDGRLHLTRDGGETWTSLEKRLRGVPDHTWIPHIEASRHEKGAAWVVLDNHRRGDWETTYLYRTTDYGRRWKRLPTDEVWGYAHVLVEDADDPDLLFLGTEFGLWTSLDGGAHWLPWTHGVPNAPVKDLAVQAREGDLVVGTHGRAAYVLDDLRPLRGLTPEILEKPIHLFAVPDAQQYRVKQTGASRFPGHGEFRGENEPYGALVTFSLNAEGLPHPDEETERQRRAAERAAKPGLWLGDRPAPEERGAEEEVEPGEEDEEPEPGEAPKAEIRITDSTGETIRSFRRPVHLGVNRIVWGLETDPFERPKRPGEEEDEDRGRGPQVLPGTYTVTVAWGGHEASGEVRVLPDPRFQISREAREARWEHVQRAGRLREANTEAIERIRELRADLQAVRRKVKARREKAEADASEEDGEETPEARLLRTAKRLSERLDELEKVFWDPPKLQGIRGDVTSSDAIGTAQWFLGSSWDRPTPAQVDYLERAERRLREHLDELEAFERSELGPFREEVRELDLQLLGLSRPIGLDEAAASAQGKP